MKILLDDVFALSKDIRYVAVYCDGELISSERSGLANTSASESDKYEELIVNPAILKLTTQRGNIDCGGCQYVIIRYGNFFEYVAPIFGGHISIGIEPFADILDVVKAINDYVEKINNLS